MESPISSSFIPHDTQRAAEKAAHVSTGGLAELTLLIGIVLFVASAALGVGVFLYKQYLATASASKLQQLQRAKAAFEPSLIQQLTRLDDRMHAADLIVASHVAPTELFHALEAATLSTVAFRSLAFTASDAQHVQVQMQGVAQSVNSIALQAEVFSKAGILTNPIFSGITRDADGVRFNFSALVNPSSINYAKLIHSQISPDASSGPIQPFVGPQAPSQSN